MTNLFVEEAVKTCKEKLKSLPELFERLIISYEKSADGYNWK
jgi:ribosomal protein L17